MRFILRAGLRDDWQAPRYADIGRIQEALKTLDFGKSYEVTIEPYTPRLPGNLQARISILIRELAQFCGYSESQMKAIIKGTYYPTETLTVAQKNTGAGIGVFTVPKATMKLTPTEARQVEAHLYSLGAELGCTLSIPQADL